MKSIKIEKASGKVVISCVCGKNVFVATALKTSKISKSVLFFKNQKIVYFSTCNYCVNARKQFAVNLIMACQVHRFKTSQINLVYRQV